MTSNVASVYGTRIAFDRLGQVIAGEASPDFFRDTAARIAEILPNGKHTVLGGQDHGAIADVVAPAVADFFSPSPVEAR